MSFKEKFEVLMKSYESVSSSNKELKNHNEYLRCQLGKAMNKRRSSLNLQLNLTKEKEVMLKVMTLNQ